MIFLSFSLSLSEPPPIVMMNFKLTLVSSVCVNAVVFLVSNIEHWFVFALFIISFFSLYSFRSELNIEENSSDRTVLGNKFRSGDWLTDWYDIVYVKDTKKKEKKKKYVQ